MKVYALQIIRQHLTLVNKLREIEELLILSKNEELTKILLEQKKLSSDKLVRLENLEIEYKE